MQGRDKRLSIVRIEYIRTDGGTQTRCAVYEQDVIKYQAIYQIAIDEKTYEYPAEAMEPVRCVYDGKYYWLYDGFHRLQALKNLNIQHAYTECYDGCLEEARWSAAGANTMHGIHLTNEDKRNAVRMALEYWYDPLTKRHEDSTEESSMRSIAKHCGVSHTMVHNMLRAMRGGQVKKVEVEEPSRKEAIGIPDPVMDDTNEQLMEEEYSEEATKIRREKKEVTDLTGVKVTPALEHAFGDMEQTLSEIVKSMKQMSKDIKAKFATLEKLYPANKPLQVMAAKLGELVGGSYENLELAAEIVQNNTPYARCVSCKSKTKFCQECFHQGWVPKWKYETQVLGESLNG